MLYTNLRIPGYRAFRTCVHPQFAKPTSKVSILRKQPSSSAVCSTDPSNDRAEGAGLDDTGLSSSQNTPDAFLQELASKPGIRIVLPDDPEYRQVGGYDEDEDEEDWDEVMSELSNPWMLDPPGNDLLEPSSPLPSNVSDEPLKVESVEIESQEQLEQLFQDIPRIAVIDVRSKDEWDQGHLPNSIHCPIQHLTGGRAKQLATVPVIILGTGDYRGAQACTRLTKVYGSLNVFYYEDGLAAWPAGVTIQEQRGL